jgi:hypothetical protein
MTRYTIEPNNEPWGEGNGWERCEPDEATAFAVWEHVNDNSDCDAIVESFDTLAKAEAWVRQENARDPTDVLNRIERISW